MVKNLLKHFVFKMPKDFIKMFYMIYNYLKFPEYREIKKSFGNLNSDKTFYIIRPRPGKVEGLMALFLDVIKQLDYADKQGYIPIVDFKNYETQYYEKGKNAWEIYFKQVSQFSLEEVYKSKNVILSGLNVLEKSPEYLNQKYDDISLTYARNLVSKYIKLNDTIENLVDKEIERLDIKNCLGLYLRGTDYVKMKPAGHPVQPTVHQAMDKVDEYLLSNTQKNIFLVTEDYEISTVIKEKYGSKVKTIKEDSYIKNYNGDNFIGIDACINQLGNEPSKRGVGYLIKLVLLSKCENIIAGNTCGSWGACVFATKFQKTYVFDLGKY